MSKEPELKARDKVVVRMTREGAVEENLTAGTEQRVSGRLEDAGAAAQREEPWSERNTGEIQQREVDSKKRQVGIQPSGSRSPGSGYGSERPGQKQSLLCRFGRAQDSVLHCREDTGPKSRDNGNRYCCCTVCLSLRSWSRPLPATGVRSSPTGAVWKNGCIARSTLPTRIAPGRKAQLKI